MTVSLMEPLAIPPGCQKAVGNSLQFEVYAGLLFPVFMRHLCATPSLASLSAPLPIPACPVSLYLCAGAQEFRINGLHGTIGHNDAAIMNAGVDLGTEFMNQAITLPLCSRSSRSHMHLLTASRIFLFMQRMY